MFEAESIFENGNPAGFLDDLPKYYYPLEKIIQEYLYLADDELSNKALSFVRWVTVAKVDGMRFDKIMTGKLKDNDKALEEFKECVFRKYELEKKLYNNSYVIPQKVKSLKVFFNEFFLN